MNYFRLYIRKSLLTFKNMNYFIPMRAVWTRQAAGVFQQLWQFRRGCCLKVPRIIRSSFGAANTKNSTQDVWHSMETVTGWWFQPLWKILVNGKDCSIYYGKIKAMFQTTNQVTYMSNVYVNSCLRNSVHISSIFQSAPRCFKWGEQTTSNGAIPRSEKKTLAF